MQTLTFAAIGTEWAILIDTPEDQLQILPAIRQLVDRFENTYSRFRQNSWVSHVNRLPSCDIPLTPDQCRVLELGFALRDATAGQFDPNTAAWQEHYGYTASYQFGDATQNPQPLPAKNRGQLHFDAHHRTLAKIAPAKIDIGAWGKGVLIDVVAQHLLEQGVQHFLVDAGGDMWGSRKQNGESWSVALKSPFHDDEAIGVVELKNQGFAASGAYYRTINNYHHLLDGQTGVPITNTAATFVCATSAAVADGLATAYFVSQEENWPNLAAAFPHSFLHLSHQKKISMHPAFPGRLLS